MSIKDNDPYYYSEEPDEDGNYDFPQGGYWLLSTGNATSKTSSLLRSQSKKGARAGLQIHLSA